MVVIFTDPAAAAAAAAAAHSCAAYSLLLLAWADSHMDAAAGGHTETCVQLHALEADVNVFDMVRVCE